MRDTPEKKTRSHSIESAFFLLVFFSIFTYLNEIYKLTGCLVLTFTDRKGFCETNQMKLSRKEQR